jgi:hypothetical protein
LIHPVVVKVVDQQRHARVRCGCDPPPSLNFIGGGVARLQEEKTTIPNASLVMLFNQRHWSLQWAEEKERIIHSMTTPIVHLLLNSEEQTDKQTKYDKTHSRNKRDRKQTRKNSRRREIPT